MNLDGPGLEDMPTIGFSPAGFHRPGPGWRTIATLGPNGWVRPDGAPLTDGWAAEVFGRDAGTSAESGVSVEREAPADAEPGPVADADRCPDCPHDVFLAHDTDGCEQDGCDCRRPAQPYGCQDCLGWCGNDACWYPPGTLPADPRVR